MMNNLDFTHQVEEWSHFFIPLADGNRLAARAWLPTDAMASPVPAILEYIPYRKRDGTAIRDEQMHPYWAGFGYAAVRVDMRGCGESTGLMLDEYLQQELDDAVEVIEWLASQPWCTGNVGMMGKSWGGFNSLQVAAMAPPALKSIITVCSTDDRYADDIHYRGGALLLENFSWASTMACYMAKAPDPLLLPDTWREQWIDRLENMPFLAKKWLEHSHKDDYWKHGSINEDYKSIRAAVYCMGGWGDSYSEAIPRMMQGLRCPKKAMIGPWAHKYPNYASPKPEMDFLGEAKRWWDYWLKGIDNGIMAEPTIAAYIQDGVPPKSAYDERPGIWVEANQWPMQAATMDLCLNTSGQLVDTAANGQATVNSPLTTGAASGEFCVIWCGPDFATEQRQDDANSLCFDTQPFGAAVSILGGAVFKARVTSDQDCGQMIVRLCDVAPDGSSTRITYGVLNLAMREGLDDPQPVVAGQAMDVTIKLDDVGYELPRGHKLRLAISTAYFPLLWPTPQKANLSLDLSSAQLTIPLHDRCGLLKRDLGHGYVCPVNETAEIRPEKHTRSTQINAANGQHTTVIDDDFGEFTFVEHNLTVGEVCHEQHSILPHDPHSATSLCQWRSRQARPGWEIEVSTSLKVTCDVDCFYLDASLEALENGQQVHAKQWQETVPRRFV
ncbi:MAG TPA: peptidase S15 [Oceanospirillaceae bacterium]|nr:peptidase S15 [Oceanospirillaceae bacterium]